MMMTSNVYLAKLGKQRLFWTAEIKDESVNVRYGEINTVGERENLKFDSIDECRTFIEEQVNDKLKEDYFHCLPDPSHWSELPEELYKQTLKNSEIETKDGSFKFLSKEDIAHITINVFHQGEMHSTYKSFKYPKTPYDKIDGSFYVEAYGFVSSKDYTNSKGFLVWIPKVNLFGTWDSDHLDLIVFPELKWEDILNNPKMYVTAQWNNRGKLKFPYVQSHLKVWEQFNFLTSGLVDKVKSRLSSEDENEVILYCHDFLSQHEKLILDFPYFPDNQSSALELVYKYLGKYFMKKQKYKEAVEWFNKELQLSVFHKSIEDKNNEVFLNLGFCFQKLNSFFQAEHYLNIFLKGENKSWFGWHTLALTLHKQNKIEKATHAYLKAIDCGTKDPYTFNNLGICMFKVNKVEAAIQFTEMAKQMNDLDPIPYYNLVCYYSRLCKEHESFVNLEEALKRGYKNMNSLMNDEDISFIRNKEKFNELLKEFKLH